MDSLLQMICPRLGADKWDRPVCQCDMAMHQADLDWLDDDTRGVAVAISHLIDSLRHNNELPLIVLALNARDEIVCRTARVEAYADRELELLVDELKDAAQAIVERMGVPE